jgi:outer membrane receptor protein involved in Fe transport
MRRSAVFIGAVILAIGCAAPRLARAQIEALPIVEEGILAGRILDETGRPVAGARVHLPERMRSTLTDAEGNFRITGLSKGRTRVVVQRAGFAPVVRGVMIAGLSSFDLQLTTTPFTLSPVIVTATRSPVAPMQTPLPSATLFGERLRRNQTVSLAHAIEVLPGVRTLSTGAEVGKPVIRGLTGPRVLVLDDGRRLEDYSWSDEDGPSVDARQVQRVEVIRGPASVLYGSDALGGVVNAVPADLPETKAGTVQHVALEIYGASNNSEGGGALRVEGGTPSLGWRLHAIGRGSGDSHSPEGTLENTGFAAFNGEGAFGVRGESGNLTLRYVRYGGEFKLQEATGPRPGIGGGTQDEGPKRQLADDRVQLGANYFISGLRLEARGQWQRHSLVEVADDPNAAPGAKKESEQFDLLLNTSTLDLLAHHESRRLRGSVGVNGMAQANDSRGPIAMVPDAHIVSGAVFAFEQYDLGRWSLLVGAREDLRHLDADANDSLRMADQTRDYESFSGDVGIVFHPVETVACAVNVGRAWRAPTLFELFANGQHLGEARYEVGDPTLAVERGLMTDASVRWQSPRFRGEVAGFRNRMDGYVVLVPTGRFRPSAAYDRLPVYRYLQTDAVLWGGEVRAEYEIMTGLTLRGRFDAVRGDDTKLDCPLPLVPPLRGVVGAEYRWGDHGWMANGILGGDVEMLAEQTRLSQFDTPTASYALLNLEGGIGRHWFGREVAVDLQVRNVLDASYRDYLSRYKVFALDPGRNVLVRLSTGF